SERRDLPWTFCVVDDPTINAFALPGGYVYVTRGILAHMENEAELASVMGHEIGHITARHSVTQMTKQQLAQLGLAGAVILKPDLEKYGQLISAGLGLLFLKFSRDDEHQADLLGLRYMYRGGYDPREMDDVFAMLDRVSGQQGGSALPNWLSTHPSSADRIQRITRMVDSLPPDFSGRKVSRNEFLQRIDGLVYGDNPREGYFRGNTFIHPDLKFHIDFPDQWQTANQKQSVAGVSPNEDALLQVSLAEAQTPAAAAQQFVSQQGISASAPQGATIGGLSAATATFSAQTGDGVQLTGTAAFVGYNGRVFEILGYGLAGQWSQYRSAVAGAIASFGPVTDQSLLNVKPRRIEIVTIPRAMTIQEFNQAYPSDSKTTVEELTILNLVQSGEKIPAGTMVKRVVAK
ncbi:MAG TPA: M48 family metalloprotease, partial [candidate division Zixibacteria bacterium]|nr:M48 family metalloprotease [candidate division Zixibacteria bacterium]